MCNRSIAGLLTCCAFLTAAVACTGPQGAVQQSPDCDAVRSREERQRREPAERTATYDHHAQFDTAPLPLTETKGCVLMHWVARWDSANGSPPESLGTLLEATPSHEYSFPEFEWREDGWRRPFAYVHTASTVLVWSYGPDGVDNTGDEIRFRVRLEPGG